MDDHAIETLVQHPLFSCLTPEEQETLARQAIRRNFSAGEVASRAGDIWAYLFLVREGSVQAIKESREGRSLVVAEIGAGEIFWGLAFFQDDTPNPVSLQFSRPSCLWLWQRATILPILLENGHFTWELSRLMVGRMLRASEVIEGLAFQPVAGRLAHLLMDYPGKADSGPTARSLTLDDMAARIGSTREMVCRLLQTFADQNLIKITRTDFEITDRDALAGMAQKVKS